MDYINIPSILNSKDVKDTLPSICQNFKTPTIVNELGPTIGKTIFNFNKFVVDHLDVEAFLQDETIIPCNCTHSKFADN